MGVKATWNDSLEFNIAFPEGETMTLASVPAAGRPGAGPSPMDAVQAAVLACTGIDVLLILGKMRKTITAFDIEMDATRRAEEPRIFTHLKVIYRLSGPDLDAASVQRTVSLSQDKYCSVAAMLRPTVAFDTHIVLNGEELAAGV